MLFLFLSQAAAAQARDIELDARLHARDVRIVDRRPLLEQLATATSEEPDAR